MIKNIFCYFYFYDGKAFLLHTLWLIVIELNIYVVGSISKVLETYVANSSWFFLLTMVWRIIFLEILIKAKFSLETNFLIVLAALYVHILLIRQHTSVRAIMVFGIPSLSHPVWGDTMGLEILDLNFHIPRSIVDQKFWKKKVMVLIL